MKVDAPKTKEEFAAYVAAMDAANEALINRPAKKRAAAKKAAGKRPAAKKPVAKTKKK